MPQRHIDVEDLDSKLASCLSRPDYPRPTERDIAKYAPIVDAVVRHASTGALTEADYSKLIRTHLPKTFVRRSFLIQVVYMMREKDLLNDADAQIAIEALRTKRGKSLSGVLVCTVFTSAHPEYTTSDGERRVAEFSCAYNCHYCPNQPGQPRSYLSLEPGVLRANRHAFDCVAQMWARMEALFHIGHPVDKVEVLVLGGTWSSYPLEYRKEFVRDIYYACNVFWTRGAPRGRNTMESERDENRSARVKVIGLTLETRPDCVNPRELAVLRSYGCTRMQIGVQHIDDGILKSINRMCYTRHTKRAIALLKTAGFKVDCHWMPNLPFSTPAKDREMLLNNVVGIKSAPSDIAAPVSGVDKWTVWDVADEDLGHDQMKLYPCAVTPYSQIEKWYKEGSYVPYAEEDLLKLLIDTKVAMYPWIRVNRLIRDIPTTMIWASSDHGHWGAEITSILKERGLRCQCIRCREVKERAWDGDYACVVRQYKGSGKTEYFISAESRDSSETLYGFVRLREGVREDDAVKPTTSSDATVAVMRTFPELLGCALIRELHVYGQLKLTSQQNDDDGDHVQHKGLGRQLVRIAEAIAKHIGFDKVAVISGEGVKDYYMRLGYAERGVGMYMIKNI